MHACLAGECSMGLCVNVECSVFSSWGLLLKHLPHVSKIVVLVAVS